MTDDPTFEICHLLDAHEVYYWDLYSQTEQWSKEARKALRDKLIPLIAHARLIGSPEITLLKKVTHWAENVDC